MDVRLVTELMLRVRVVYHHKRREYLSDYNSNGSLATCNVLLHLIQKFIFKEIVVIWERIRQRANDVQ